MKKTRIARYVEEFEIWVMNKAMKKTSVIVTNSYAIEVIVCSNFPTLTSSTPYLVIYGCLY